MTKLGIMVETVDTDEYRALHQVSAAAGFQTMYLFTPDQVDWAKKRITGWVYNTDKKRWTREINLPFPDLIYDRGLYSKSKQLRNAIKLYRHSGIPFVGQWLGNNKWIIQKHMATNNKLRPHLIPSISLTDADSVLTMLSKHKILILKPVGAHSGMGILKVYIENETYCMKENDKPVLRLSKKQFTSKIMELKRKGKYLIQKWIKLHDNEKRIFDIRVLMQKNKYGRWYLTGMGVRRGKPGSITSNLATGGKAIRVVEYLTKIYGEQRAKGLEEKLRSLSFELSNHLEHSFGKRLVELGLDFGIDPQSRIWIIEANTKPRKKVIETVGTTKQIKDSYQLPILFAGYLVRNKKNKP